MKKFPILIAFVLFLNGIKGQDTVVLRHHFYTSTFIKSKHIPLLVEYTLTNEMVSCTEKIKRKNKFSPDPLLHDATNLETDYKGSHYDRGHNMSAADNSCNEEGMNECFYFSNMFPQTHSLNAGTWERLEKQERVEAKEYGKIKVFIGSFGEIKKMGADSVVVPAYCWKVIYIETNNTYECYIFPNTILESHDYESYQVPLMEIEEKTNIKFNHSKSIIK